ncbi:uncharacterized protein [Littorina saxatilis]|uniref:uncharacterized protein n=1 Tax=Littorina saxatilis TaxID=31220 RepID=UPI0038B5BF64
MATADNHSGPSGKPASRKPLFQLWSEEEITRLQELASSTPNRTHQFFSECAEKLSIEFLTQRTGSSCSAKYYDTERKDIAAHRKRIKTSNGSRPPALPAMVASLQNIPSLSHLDVITGDGNVWIAFEQFYQTIYDKSPTLCPLLKGNMLQFLQNEENALCTSDSENYLIAFCALHPFCYHYSTKVTFCAKVLKEMEMCLLHTQNNLQFTSTMPAAVASLQNIPSLSHLDVITRDGNVWIAFNELYETLVDNSPTPCPLQKGNMLRFLQNKENALCTSDSGKDLIAFRALHPFCYHYSTEVAFCAKVLKEMEMCLLHIQGNLQATADNHSGPSDKPASRKPLFQSWSEEEITRLHELASSTPSRTHQFFNECAEKLSIEFLTQRTGTSCSAKYYDTKKKNIAAYRKRIKTSNGSRPPALPAMVASLRNIPSLSHLDVITRDGNVWINFEQFYQTIYDKSPMLCPLLKGNMLQFLQNKENALCTSDSGKDLIAFRALHPFCYHYSTKVTFCAKVLKEMEVCLLHTQDNLQFTSTMPAAVASLQNIPSLSHLDVITRDGNVWIAFNELYETLVDNSPTPCPLQKGIMLRFLQNKENALCTSDSGKDLIAFRALHPFCYHYSTKVTFCAKVLKEMEMCLLHIQGNLQYTPLPRRGRPEKVEKAASLTGESKTCITFCATKDTFDAWHRIRKTHNWNDSQLATYLLLCYESSLRSDVCAACGSSLSRYCSKCFDIATKETSSWQPSSQQPSSKQPTSEKPSSRQRFSQQPVSPQQFSQQPASPQQFSQQPASPQQFSQQPASPQQFSQQPASSQVKSLCSSQHRTMPLSNSLSSISVKETCEEARHDSNNLHETKKQGNVEKDKSELRDNEKHSVVFKKTKRRRETACTNMGVVYTCTSEVPNVAVSNGKPAAIADESNKLHEMDSEEQCERSDTSCDDTNVVHETEVVRLEVSYEDDGVLFPHTTIYSLSPLIELGELDFSPSVVDDKQQKTAQLAGKDDGCRRQESALRGNCHLPGGRDVVCESVETNQPSVDQNYSGLSSTPGSAENTSLFLTPVSTPNRLMLPAPVPTANEFTTPAPVSTAQGFPCSQLQPGAPLILELGPAGEGLEAVLPPSSGHSGRSGVFSPIKKENIHAPSATKKRRMTRNVPEAVFAASSVDRGKECTGQQSDAPMSTTFYSHSESQRQDTSRPKKKREKKLAWLDDHGLFPIFVGSSGQPESKNEVRPEGGEEGVGERGEQTPLPFKCPRCDCMLESFKLMMSHLRSHPCPDLQCPVCKKQLTIAFSLSNHVCSARQQPGPFTCTICAATLASLKSYQIHFRSHSGSKPWVCSVCCKGFTQKWSCIDHLLIHTGLRTFSCPQCNETFVTQNALYKHKFTHSGNKQHICEKCGRGFHKATILRGHLLTHTDERPYPCQLCPARFKSRTNLTVHRKWHAGERPYQCETCGKTFVARGRLVNHFCKTDL